MTINWSTNFQLGMIAGHRCLRKSQAQLHKLLEEQKKHFERSKVQTIISPHGAGTGPVPGRAPSFTRPCLQEFSCAAVDTRKYCALALRAYARIISHMRVRKRSPAEMYKKCSTGREYRASQKHPPDLYAAQPRLYRWCVEHESGEIRFDSKLHHCSVQVLQR